MPVIGANTYPNSGALTISLASLASTTADPPVGRESTEALQSTDLGLDVLLDGIITTGTSPTAARRIRVWAWGGGWDGSTARRPAGATGSDAGLTPMSHWADVFRPLIIINTSATSNVGYTFAGVSLLAAFGGLMLPPRWGIFVDHNTGVALNSSAGNHAIRYTVVKANST